MEEPSLHLKGCQRILWNVFVFLALLACMAFCASEDDSCKKTVDCFHCDTAKGHAFCHDPFNETIYEKHLGRFYRVTCKEMCVKLIRKPKKNSNKVNVVRTCSGKRHNLILKVTKADGVCMEESRTGFGKMCLCQKDDCNAATVARGSSTMLLISGILAAILPFRFYISQVPIVGKLCT